MQIAAKYSGLSSNQIVLPSSNQGAAPLVPQVSTKVIAREEVWASTPEVPAYETFKMR